MRRLIALLLPMLFVASSALASQAGEPYRSLVVFYGGLHPSTDFEKYDVVVFDSELHPILPRKQDSNRVVLGYLSIGEEAHYRTYFSDLQKKRLLLDALDTEKKHFRVDITNPAWAAYVVEDLVPALLRQGFDGVMLDTADTPLAMASKDPAKHGKMKEATVALIRTLRMHYPDITIMINRGFDVLPEIADSIDMVLAESIYTTVSAKDGSYVFQPKEHYQSVADMLKQLQLQYPHLTLFSLDYWNPDDAKTVRAIYETQAERGFVPYVATPDLQKVVARP